MSAPGSRRVGELRATAGAARPVGEEVGVEREDHLRRAEVVARLERPAEAPAARPRSAPSPATDE